MRKMLKSSTLVAAAILAGAVNVASATELRSHTLVDFRW